MGKRLGVLWVLTKIGLVLLIGSALLVGGWTFHQDAQEATAKATEIKGTVIETNVTEVEVHDAEGSGTHTEYAPEIEYRYTAEGETYTSTSICPGPAEACEASNARSRENVEAFLERYPEGEAVTVYILPDEPTRSFLVETESGSIAHYLMMAIGGMTLLGGLGALAGSLKEFVFG